MATHVYHWKHGWIPLDHVAAAKHHGSKAEEAHLGIKTRRDVAKAASTVKNVPAGPDRQHAAAQTRKAAERIGATDLLPAVRRVEAQKRRVDAAQSRVDAAQTRLDNANEAIAIRRAAPGHLNTAVAQAVVLHGRGSDQHKAAVKIRDDAGRANLNADLAGIPRSDAPARVAQPTTREYANAPGHPVTVQVPGGEHYSGQIVGPDPNDPQKVVVKLDLDESTLSTRVSYLHTDTPIVATKIPRGTIASVNGRAGVVVADPGGPMVSFRPRKGAARMVLRSDVSHRR